MRKLQRLLQKRKEFGAFFQGIHFNEKSRRVFIFAVAAAATAICFIASPLINYSAVCAHAAAIGRSCNEALAEIALADLDVLKTASLHEKNEQENNVRTGLEASGHLEANGQTGILKETGKEETVEIFGERDFALERDAFRGRDFLSEMALYSESNLSEGIGLFQNKKKDAESAGAGEANEEGKAKDAEGEGKTEDAKGEGAGKDSNEGKAEPASAKDFYASIDFSDIPNGLVLNYNAGYCMKLSAEQRKVLETIVEAEAGDEDVYGKILVANVVLNRVLSEEFPDTVKEVVFQNNGKVYQFSPVRSGGRYYTVTVSEHTKKAVDRALRGEDYSEGAMYFFARRYTPKAKANWFDTALRKIVEYGCHEFFGDQ